MPRTLIYGLLGLLLISPPALTRERPFIDEPDNTINNDFVEKEWKEGEYKLPEGYKDENLQSFQINDASDFNYFIDRTSLNLSEDGISRFILVIRSASGVDNASYEGIRCGQREYRVYAYGNQQGFTPMPDSEWQHISRSGSGNYRNFLYSNLICDTTTGKAIPAKAVIDAMHRNTKTRTTPFLID